MEINSNPRESDRRNPLDFFSTLPLTRNGGGNFVVGASLFTELEKQAPGSRYFHVPVRTSRIDSLVSKIQRRVFRIPSHFVPYGPACLARMSDRVGEMLSASCSAAFFKGITPWADWKPDRPYAAYTDVALATILESQGSRRHFSKRDIERILGAERTFLEGASAVYFESRWGMEMTRQHYELAGEHFTAVGRAGLFEAQERDLWSADSQSLITIAKHFELKGGDLVHEAFLRLKAEFPDLSWHIIGGEPGFDWRTVAGVEYHGFLNPEDFKQRQHYLALLKNAFLLVHPTREDTNPLVISEAAAFGCPAVSVNGFAIPELVDHGQTGVLLPIPVSAEQLSEAIRNLLLHPLDYREMRRNSLMKARHGPDWFMIGQKILDDLRDRPICSVPKRSPVIEEPVDQKT